MELSSLEITLLSHFAGMSRISSFAQVAVTLSVRGGTVSYKVMLGNVLQI